jgi:hypothetical protein
MTSIYISGRPTLRGTSAPRLGRSSVAKHQIAHAAAMSRAQVNIAHDGHEGGRTGDRSSGRERAGSRASGHDILSVTEVLKTAGDKMAVAPCGDVRSRMRRAALLARGVWMNASKILDEPFGELPSQLWRVTRPFDSPRSGPFRSLGLTSVDCGGRVTPAQVKKATKRAIQEGSDHGTQGLWDRQGRLLKPQSAQGRGAVVGGDFLYPLSRGHAHHAMAVAGHGRRS